MFKQIKLFVFLKTTLFLHKKQLELNIILRVTSGTRRGAQLIASPDLSIRPTTDKVKQSIFNMIQFDIAERTVLDLFAGSGAMGIEALSRGAKHCTFVDIDTKIAEKNIQKVRFSEQSDIIKKDFSAFLKQTNSQFDLVFLDPPYQKGMLDTALSLLVQQNLLLPGCLIVMECDIAEEITIPADFTIIKERNFGKIQFRIGAYQ